MSGESKIYYMCYTMLLLQVAYQMLRMAAIISEVNVC